MPFTSLTTGTQSKARHTYFEVHAQLSAFPDKGLDESHKTRDVILTFISPCQMRVNESFILVTIFNWPCKPVNERCALALRLTMCSQVKTRTLQIYHKNDAYSHWKRENRRLKKREQWSPSTYNESADNEIEYHKDEDDED